MKFLIDNSLSPRLSMGLQAAGYNSVHVRELGLAAATDEVIFDHALYEERVIVAADNDFGTLLAQRRGSKPYRHVSNDTAESLDAVLDLT